MSSASPGVRSRRIGNAVLRLLQAATISQGCGSDHDLAQQERKKQVDFKHETPTAGQRHGHFDASSLEEAVAQSPLTTYGEKPRQAAAPSPTPLQIIQKSRLPESCNIY